MFTVDLLDILHIVRTSHENGRALMDLVGDNVENAFGPGRCATARVLHAFLFKGKRRDEEMNATNLIVHPYIKAMGKHS